MSFKQYENFMDIQQKTKSPGWTSEQSNFIVGSKTINEKAMDTNLEKIGINQKNKKKSKMQQSRKTSTVSSTSSKPTMQTYTKTNQDQRILTARRDYNSP
jgi:hypothetical protein